MRFSRCRANSWPEPNIARAKHVHIFCTSYHSFKTLGQTTKCTAVKLSGLEYSQVDCIILRAMCNVPLARGPCFDSFASCARTAERIWTGHTLFGPEQRHQHYEFDCNMLCATWDVPMTHGTLFDKFSHCSWTADLIWTGPTTFDTGKGWERRWVDIWMFLKRHMARASGTWHTTWQNYL